MKIASVNALALSICAAILGAVQLAGAAGTTYWSGGGGGGNQNWSASANWTTLGGSTPPAAGDAVIFRTTGSAGAAGTIDNIVDAGFTAAIGSLWCSNDVANTFHTTQIPAGNTLTVNGPIIIGTNNQTATYTFTGGGTLKGGSGTSQFALATLNGGTLTFDLTPLTNFVYNAGGAGGNFVVGQDAGASSGGVLKLASISNNITATTLIVGNNNSSGTSTLNLGAGTNIINAGTLNVSFDKSVGTLQFNSTSGGLRLRNAAGTGRATVSVGGNGHSGSSSANTAGNVFLKGHYVDMQIGTLTLANRGARSGGSISVYFSFDTGIVDCTSITGSINASGSPNGTGPTNILSVGGGTLKVANNISLVNCAGNPGLGTLFITNGGSVTCSSIIKTTANGSGNVTINNGTLTLSSSAGVIGTPGIPLDSISLTNATLHLNLNATLTDPRIVATTVNTNGANTIIIDTLVGASGPVTIPLISYTGTDPFGSLTLNLSALPAGYSGHLDDSVPGLVQLVINAPVANALVWVGATNSVPVSNWDTNKTKNWVDVATMTAPQVYADPDTVLFDDTASNGVVTLMNPVAPYSVTFNNVLTNYVLNGTGKITGIGALTNLNTGTVTLADTGGDNFSGGIAVNAGTLILDNANSAISGGVLIAAGATLQIGNNDANGALPSGTLDDEGTLAVKRSDNFTIAASIPGAGALTQNGSGSLTLSASNSYAGITTVSRGTLALTGSALISASAGVLVSNATLDVSAIISRSTVLNDFSITNATLTLNPTNLQIPLSVATFEADGIIARSNIINVIGLPPVAFYPSTITLVKSAAPITLTGGNFNFALGSLPAGFAGSLTENGNSTAIQLTLTSGPTGTRASTIWAGIPGATATTNWSDNVNWQLPGAPGAADNVIFDTTSTVSAPTTVNNVVDANITIAGATYSSSNSQYQVTQIPAGNVLTVNNTFTVGGNIMDNAVTHAVFTDAGTLVVNANNANLVGSSGSAGSSGTASLDLSGLSNFVYNASSATFGVGNIGGRGIGTIALAGVSNNITAGTVAIMTSSASSSVTATSTLGAGTNIINASTINIAATRASGTLQFPASTVGGLRIRGTGGTDSDRSTVVLGNRSSGGTSGHANGNLLLNDHPVDLKLATLTLGQCNQVAPVDANGTLQFNQGTVDVTGVLMAILSASGGANGTLTAGGGTLIVGSGGISLVNGTVAPTSPASNIGNLNLTGTTVICSNSIVKTTTLGTGNISLTDSTLDMVSGTIGTPAAPIDSLTLSDNGTFDNKITVNVVAGVPSIVASSISASGVTTINIGAITGVIGTAQIPVISYTPGGSPAAGVTLGTTPAGYTGASLVDSGTSIDLLITSPAPIVWKGAVGATLTSTWDTSTQDWLNGVTPVAYANTQFVQFDDTASTNVVNLTVNVAPPGLDVSNNLVSYTFIGSSKIGGSTALTKQGTGKLVVDNSGINDFAGGVNIVGGTVQFGNNDANGNIPTSGNITDNGTLAFGRTDSNTVANLISGTGGVTQSGSGTSKLTAANTYSGATLINGGTLVVGNTGAATGNSALGVIPGGAVTITNGGTLDLSGIATANTIGFTNASGQAKQFYIAGAGVGGNGVIVNNGTVNQQNAFQLITLTANATVGGPARWDMRGNAAVTPQLDLGGFTLTKTGTNQMSMVNLQVINGGGIVINSGIFSFETTSSDSTAPITVNAGGVLGHFRQAAGLFTAPITLNGGMIRDLNGGPGATNDSPITLTANSFLDLNVNSTDRLQLNGIISESGGSFGLTKTNGGSFALSAVDTYSGTTLVQSGRLILTGNGSIANSKTLTVAAGANLDVSERNDTTLTLNPNQTLTGFGSVTGLVTTLSGSTVAPGSASSTGTLTVNGNTTLSGTNLMKVSRTSGATNDIVLVNGALAVGGTLTVSSLGGSYVNGDTFTLFKATGGITGTFTATNLPVISGFAWVTTNLANGVLSLLATVNTTPTNITTVVSGSTLTLSWPADHIGWRLQAQTNALGAGLNPASGAWFDVPGSTSVNSVNVTVNPANGTVFYRMVYP